MYYECKRYFGCLFCYLPPSSTFPSLLPVVSQSRCWPCDLFVSPELLALLPCVLNALTSVLFVFNSHLFSSPGP